MATNNDYKADNKVYKWLYVSVWLFVLVLILNIWLYFYNSSLSSNVESLNKELTTLGNDIEKINSDDKVKLYILIKANVAFLDRYEYLSRIPEFINNLKELSKTYKVSFKNFSYSNSVIATQATALDDGLSLWYQKSQNLISSFRDNKKTENKNDQIFSLDFIDYFEWQNEIKFNVNFKIK